MSKPPGLLAARTHRALSLTSVDPNTSSCVPIEMVAGRSPLCIERLSCASDSSSKSLGAASALPMGTQSIA
eukprot:scaffold206613_cov26-Tisochrysis_lutea.AAC.3